MTDSSVPTMPRPEDKNGRTLELVDYHAKEITGVEVGRQGHKLHVCVDECCVLRVVSPRILCNDQREGPPLPDLIEVGNIFQHKKNKNHYILSKFRVGYYLINIHSGGVWSDEPGDPFGGYKEDFEPVEHNPVFEHIELQDAAKQAFGALVGALPGRDTVQGQAKKRLRSILFKLGVLKGDSS